MTFRGGRLPAEPARPHLKFAKYSKALGPAPASADWLSQVSSWQMLLNDQLGDCTFAGTGHKIAGDTRYGQGATQQITDQDALTGYEAVGGYRPGDSSTDNGCVMQDVLKYWQKTGVGGHKIAAYAKVDISNLDELKWAIALFGQVYAGFNFPDSAMDQFNAGQPWDVVKGAKLDGGHCVTIGAFDADGLDVVTWGKRQRMTWAFFKKYFDEVWVALDDDFESAKTGLDAQGWDRAQLGVDFTALTGDASPWPADPTPPTPQPIPAPTPVPSSCTGQQVVDAIRDLFKKMGF
ncbi:hypothetical protein [Streptacidiphilus sp. PAMC 29251]